MRACPGRWPPGRWPPGRWAARRSLGRPLQDGACGCRNGAPRPGPPSTAQQTGTVPDLRAPRAPFPRCVPPTATPHRVSGLRCAHSLCPWALLSTCPLSPGAWGPCRDPLAGAAPGEQLPVGVGAHPSCRCPRSAFEEGQKLRKQEIVSRILKEEAEEESRRRRLRPAPTAADRPTLRDRTWGYIADVCDGQTATASPCAPVASQPGTQRDLQAQVTRGWGPGDLTATRKCPRLAPEERQAGFPRVLHVGGRRGLMSPVRWPHRWLCVSP